MMNSSVISLIFKPNFHGDCASNKWDHDANHAILSNHKWVKLENVVNILSNRLQIINATVYQFFYLRMRERNLKIS